jgi:hypothetical protein
MATHRIKLGELLVRAGVINETKLNAALAEQKRWGGRLGKVLVDMSFVTEDLIVKALSKQLGIPRATFQNVNVPRELMEKIDLGFARSTGICPEHFDAGTKTLTVAMVDPTNVTAIDELAFKTGLKVQTTIAGEAQVNEAIDRFLGPGIPFGTIASFQQPRFGGDPEAMAFAATGLAIDDPESGHPTADTNFSEHPSAPSPQLSFTQPPAPIPASPAPTSEALDFARRLDGAQRQQHKAIRAMIELLIEKGVFSQEEFITMVSKR